MEAGKYKWNSAVNLLSVFLKKYSRIKRGTFLNGMYVNYANIEIELD